MARRGSWRGFSRFNRFAQKPDQGLLFSWVETLQNDLKPPAAESERLILDGTPFDGQEALHGAPVVRVRFAFQQTRFFQAPHAHADGGRGEAQPIRDLLHPFDPAIQPNSAIWAGETSMAADTDWPTPSRCMRPIRFKSLSAVSVMSWILWSQIFS